MMDDAKIRQLAPMLSKLRDMELLLAPSRAERRRVRKATVRVPVEVDLRFTTIAVRFFSLCADSLYPPMSLEAMVRTAGLPVRINVAGRGWTWALKEKLSDFLKKEQTS